MSNEGLFIAGRGQGAFQRRAGAFAFEEALIKKSIRAGLYAASKLKLRKRVR